MSKAKKQKKNRDHSCLCLSLPIPSQCHYIKFSIDIVQPETTRKKIILDFIIK